MPRIGAAYDLFGNGRTAVKVSLGRYVTPTNSTEAYAGGQNPISRVATMTNRSWTDNNRNFVPDCDLLNPALNGECGPWSNHNFGGEGGLYHHLRSRSSHRLEQARVQLGFDHDKQLKNNLAPRVSVELSYARRVWGNFQVTDNRPSGRPTSTRSQSSLPRISGCRTAAAIRFGSTTSTRRSSDSSTTSSRSEYYGKQIYHFNGIDVNVNARFPFALTLQGGFSTGNMTEDDCEVGERLPEIYILPGSGGTLSAVQSIAQWSRSYCHRESGYLTHVKGLVTYTIPKVDVLISGTIQSKP